MGRSRKPLWSLWPPWVRIPPSPPFTQALFPRARMTACGLFRLYAYQPIALAGRERTESMKPRITVITLGVDDLQKSLRFYRDGLGLPSKGIERTEFEHGAVAFFDLQGGVRLALFPRQDLALDGHVPLANASPTEFSIAQNVSSKAEVDAIMGEAQRAGA